MSAGCAFSLFSRVKLLSTTRSVLAQCPGEDASGKKFRKKKNVNRQNNDPFSQTFTDSHPG